MNPKSTLNQNLHHGSDVESKIKTNSIVCSKEEFGEKERARERQRDTQRDRETERQRDHCLLQRGVGSRMGKQHQWRHLMSSSSIFLHTRSRMKLIGTPVETLSVFKQQGANHIVAAIENTRAGGPYVSSPAPCKVRLRSFSLIQVMMKGFSPEGSTSP